MPKAKKRITTIRLSPELLTRLGELADMEGLPRARLIENVLAGYVWKKRAARRKEGPFE